MCGAVMSIKKMVRTCGTSLNSRHPTKAAACSIIKLKSSDFSWGVFCHPSSSEGGGGGGVGPIVSKTDSGGEPKSSLVTVLSNWISESGSRSSGFILLTKLSKSCCCFDKRRFGGFRSILIRFHARSPAHQHNKKKKNQWKTRKLPTGPGPCGGSKSFPRQMLHQRPSLRP
jgi:hypothetical protein